MERETIRYYKIKDDHKEYQFVYSINEIERIIYEKFMWQHLEKIYVDLQGYLYSNTYLSLVVIFDSMYSSPFTMSSFTVVTLSLPSTTATRFSG